MRKERFFYVCEHCGNLVEMIYNAGVPLVCCGQKMTRLVANTVEASAEKHLPAVTIEGNVVKVNVGSVEHPMLPEHHIKWIFVETLEGCQRKCIKDKDKPYAEFALADGDKVTAVYAYCNLHGLWLTDL